MLCYNTHYDLMMLTCLMLLSVSPDRISSTISTYDKALSSQEIVNSPEIDLCLTIILKVNLNRTQKQ